MDEAALLQFRQEKDDFFANGDQSPLGHSARHEFTGLRYYPPNHDLVHTVAVEPGDGTGVKVQTSDGNERTYTREGSVSLVIKGETVALKLYSTGHQGYFVPFRDATSGEETYGAGRYLDVDLNSDGTVTIDFNYAYNPYCAYNDGYSCPLPPVENWLRVPIEAGELDYPRQPGPT